MKVLEKYQKEITSAIEKHLEQMGEDSALRRACSYSLFSGGKRIRPAMTLMMCDALGKGGDAMPSAIGIEFFHTASLIADDMPSMDDDDVRRNMPTLHKKFGDGVALLASYVLISAGYETISLNVSRLMDLQASFSKEAAKRGILALENATRNTGLEGATGGQLLDLMPGEPNLNQIKEIIHKKTSSLFEIALVYGWLFGGGDIDKLPLVTEAARHFGLAFQLVDDLSDQEQDSKNGRIVNIANRFGQKLAIELFHEEQSGFKLKMKELGVYSKEFKSLIDELDPLTKLSFKI